MPTIIIVTSSSNQPIIQYHTSSFKQEIELHPTGLSGCARSLKSHPHKARLTHIHRHSHTHIQLLMLKRQHYLCFYLYLHPGQQPKIWELNILLPHTLPDSKVLISGNSTQRIQPMRSGKIQFSGSKLHVLIFYLIMHNG